MIIKCKLPNLGLSLKGGKIQPTNLTQKNPNDTVETRLIDDPLNNPAKSTAQERTQHLFMSIVKIKEGFAFNVSLPIH